MEPADTSIVSEHQAENSFTKDGLTVSFDEENSTISFTWSEETNPEWNWISEVDKKEVIARMCNHFGFNLDDLDVVEIDDSDLTEKKGGEA
jgi:hypothetical protein